ncbi:hypothetical protein PQX77_008434 [Marasmius sp. AFHP31]|nr:hypothetical protein PQX77_013047 [Marasmius sp. AFHP31]KAK1228569.1 hypothetical protein PQX77_008434 [Marasmius sp. AFHP31]
MEGQSRFENGQHQSSEVLEAKGDVLLTYQLPPLVKAKERRWIGTLKTGAVTSSILTAISTQLLVLHKNRIGPHIPLAILTHLSFVLNLSSTLSALLLANKFAALVDVSARRDFHGPQSGYLHSSIGTLGLFRIYGLNTTWNLMVFHWLICSSLGVGCLFAQVMVFVWTDEALSVQITTTCVVAFASIPILLAFRLITN